MLDSQQIQKNIERWALFCPAEASELPYIDHQAVTISPSGLMHIQKEEGVFSCQDDENPLEEAQHCLLSFSFCRRHSEAHKIKTRKRQILSSS